MLIESKLCDLTVTVQSHAFGCNKFILSAHSGFFSDLIRSIGKGINQMFVDLPNIPGGAPTFEKLLNFCNHDENLELDIKSCLELLSAAETLRMNSPVAGRVDTRNLSEVCSSFLEHQPVRDVLSALEDLDDDSKIDRYFFERLQSRIFQFMIIVSGVEAQVGAVKREDETLEFFEALVLLPGKRVSPILDSLNTQFPPEATRADVFRTSESFLVALERSFEPFPNGKPWIMIGTGVVHSFGLLAEFLLKRFREGMEFFGSGERISLPKAEDGNSIFHILVILEFFTGLETSLEFRARIKTVVKRLLTMCLMKVSWNLRSLSPRSVVMLGSSYLKREEDPELKDLGFKLLSTYLKQVPVQALEEFAQIVSLVSVHAACHDALHDIITKHLAETSEEVSDEMLRDLLGKISWVRLSREKLDNIVTHSFCSGQEKKKLEDLLRKKCRYCKYVKAADSETDDEWAKDKPPETISSRDPANMQIQAYNHRKRHHHQCQEQKVRKKIKTKSSRPKEIHISVIIGATSYSFNVWTSSTVAEVKRKVSKNLPQYSELSYLDQVLENDKTLDNYHLRSFSVLKSCS